MTLAPSEAAIQAQIVRFLRLTGWTVWEMQLGSAGKGSVYCTRGIPDLYVFRAGQPGVWLEVKRPKLGRLSPHQRERHAEATHAGVPVHVITSVEEALEVLK